MIDYQYSYLIGSIPFMIIWVFLYWRRKDLRREMEVMSLLIGFMSVATSYFWWTVDWWRPLTMTGTRVGIEDFLVGFGSGGIIAVIYEEVLGMRYSRKHLRSQKPSPVTILILMAALTSLLIWGLHLTSFVSSILALSSIACILLYYRKDLFFKGLITGVLMILVSMIAYYTIIFFQPDWVLKTYRFETLSRILFLGIPIEELIFWLFAGMVFGTFYEYWQGTRLIPIKARK